MKFTFFCTRWGSENIDWPTFISKVIDAGYNGIEWGPHAGTSDKELDDVFHLTQKNKLRLIIQHWDTYDADFSRHYDNYSKWFQRLQSYQPYKINSQTGKDYFTVEQNIQLVHIGDDYASATGIAVMHETHRNKFLFAAHVSKQYFDALPKLQIALDVSHWVNVAESYLQDQQVALQTAFHHTHHLHARVGHPEGPQITDPRLPQWKEACDIHFTWWQQLAEMKRHEEELTVTPEFGPHPYMTLLSNGEPFANQWDINEYMMKTFKERCKPVSV